MKVFRNAANIHGYTQDGSYRYDNPAKYGLTHSRLVSMHDDNHRTYNSKYNGTWTVIPPFKSSVVQRSIWHRLSLIAGKTTGRHPRHRLTKCADPQELQQQLSVGSDVGLVDQLLTYIDCTVSKVTTSSFKTKTRIPTIPTRVSTLIHSLKTCR